MLKSTEIYFPRASYPEEFPCKEINFNRYYILRSSSAICNSMGHIMTTGDLFLYSWFQNNTFSILE